jgi:hypothetical protein
MKATENELVKALEETLDGERKNKTLKQCKICNQYKIKINDGKRPDGRNTRFVGEDGLEWCGKICPVCHKNNVKNHLANKRLK